MELSDAELKAVFCEAANLPPGPEREAYLDRVCPAGSPMRHRVEMLLRAHDDAGRFLDSSPGPAEAPDPATAPASTASPAVAPAPGDPEVTATHPEAAADHTNGRHAPAEKPGSRIGPYTLLRVIGEGGMGVVYEAEQTAPVRRTVALKVIKPGMDTAAVLTRFDAERQALALMDHPNIARVHDAGTTDTGRPYFVMERVDGVPMADYCDNARLTPSQRLELFIPVCQAIQHAHQKGIIHRDIKPSNVLVTVVDGKPVPKVIDFGVAKAIDQRNTERTLFTRLGAIVGTPEYMSPEQAGASPDIDTRTDIYSLGVLLYELLTGTTPLDRNTLRQAAFDEVLRRVREEEPPKPSTRLSELSRPHAPREGCVTRSVTTTVASVAAQRATEPARLAKLVRGDIDWIVMKALDKDRTRRYETPSALARDLQRYLDGDPVDAGPPSAVYRLRKFARKHRAALATVGVFAALLVLASVVSTLLMLRARSAERLAKERLSDLTKANAATTQALAQTRQAQAETRAEADKAKAINEFLTKDLLTQAEPANNSVEDHVSLLDVLDRAADKVGDRFAGQPEVEDALRQTIAVTYHGLASWEKAERQWRAVLDAARKRHGPESAEALGALSALAHILSHQGRLAEAVDMARSASDGFARVVGPDDPDSLVSRGLLAKAYLLAGRIGEGTAILEANLKRFESTLGPDHPHTFATRADLAFAYRLARRTTEAIALGEAALKSSESRLGVDHPETLQIRGHLADAYIGAGRTGDGIKLHEATLKLQEPKLGPDHPETLRSRVDLANAYLEAGRVADAVNVLEPTLKLEESKLGREHLATRDNLAAAYRAAGRTGDAIKLHEATLKVQESKLGPDHPDTLASHSNLASAYFDAGRTAEAIKLLEPTLKLLESKLGPDHPDTLTSRNNLAMAYRAASRLSDAVPLFEHTLKRSKAKLGPDEPLTLLVMNNLAAAYLDCQRWAEAETTARECLGLREKKQPGDWWRFHTLNQLGAALAGQKKFAEAEPLLIQGYDGLRARETKISARQRKKLAEAGARIVKLYEAWGKPHKAAEWRKEVETAAKP